MSVDKAALEETFAAILDTSTTPASVTEYATQIADAVDNYLASAELDPFPAVGENPASGTPVPDPTATASGMELTSAPDPALVGTTFRTQFLADTQTALAGTRNYSLSNAAFQADLQLLAANSDAAGYAGTGATTATPPNIDAAFDIGQAGGTHLEVAAELANQIHTSTMSVVYVLAAYANGLFAAPVGPPPAVPVDLTIIDDSIIDDS